MKYTGIRTTTSVVALVAALALAPSIAAAQDNSAGAGAAAGQSDVGADIVVTAQRRSEASRDVPISVTTLSQNQLAVANVNQLSDTAKLTPGLRFDTQGPAMQPSIRGVGTAITTSGGGPNVGIYVDGFFQPNTYVSDFQLMRVKNIQVLKGPQGTLFGRNTTGGAILVTTADPSKDPSAEFKATYGRFNALTLQGYATAGLNDKIAVDIEGLYRRGDGYLTNILNNDKNIGKYENWSIRAGIKVELTDTVSVLLRYTHAEVSDPTTQLVNAYVDTTGEAGFFKPLTAAGNAIYGSPTSSAGRALVYFYAPSSTYTSKPGDVAITTPVNFEAKSDTVQATIKADLGFADLTSYTQYRHDHTPYHGDLDATALDAFNILVDVKDQTFSQEFLLNSKPGSRLQWTAGLNYFQNKDDWSNIQASGFDVLSPTLIPFGGSNTKTVSYAAFADVTYAVIPEKLFLTAGGRYSHDVVTDAYFIANPFTQFPPAFGGGYSDENGNPVNCGASCPPGTVIGVNDLKHDSVTPRVVVRYKPSTTSSVYASYTRGYKAGILNVGGLSKQPVNPETNDAFEVGYKYGDRKFSLDLAGFYYNYKNLQVSSFQSGAAQIRNAASARIYGIEGQLLYRATPRWDINLGATWTHARYKSFPNAPYYSYCDPSLTSTTAGLNCAVVTVTPLVVAAGSLAQTTTDASGLHMQRSPDFTGNLSTSYRLPVMDGELTLSGNLYYTSSFFFDPSEQFKQKGYEVLSLRAQWVDPSKRYTVAVFGDNATNKRYQTQVLFNTLGIGSVWNSPAVWGVSLGAKF